MTLLWTAVGVVLAVALARRAKRPARTFVISTAVLTMLSFAAPVTTHFTIATNLVLDVTHVAAAAIVIPTLAQVLAVSRPRNT